MAHRWQRNETIHAKVIQIIIFCLIVQRLSVNWKFWTHNHCKYLARYHKSSRRNRMLEPKLEGNRGLITFYFLTCKSNPTCTKLAGFTLQREPCVHYEGQAFTGLVNEQTTTRKKSTRGYKTPRLGAWGFSSNMHGAGKLTVTSSTRKGWTNQRSSTSCHHQKMGRRANQPLKSVENWEKGSHSQDLLTRRRIYRGHSW